MPIDFSRINLSRGGTLPKGGNVVKAPPKKGRIDYGTIKLSNIYTPTRVAPKPAAIPKNAGKGAPITFQGRPLVTPVEQQRMKAATPKSTPTTVSRLTGKTVEQRTLEGKQMASAFAGKSLFDGFKEATDSYNNAQAKSVLGQNAPAAGGITGNRWVDLGASLTTMGAVIKTGVQVVGGLVSAINFTRAMNSKWNWPTVEGGVASNDIAVRVAQANPKMDEETASSIASLVARTGGNAAQLNALASNTSTLSRSLNQMSNAARNPSTALNIIPSAARAIAQTGIFQAIPMPAGLVHSTAPAIPMGDGTLPAASVATSPTFQNQNGSPAAPSALTAKQPWEMTRAEYALKGGEISYSAPRGVSTHRDAVEAAHARGEKISPEVLKDYPWLAADDAIKSYVDGLGNLSDKQLKVERKQVADQLTKYANDIPTFLPSGKLNPAVLGTQAYFEISNKFAAINDEIDAREGKIARVAPAAATPAVPVAQTTKSYADIMAKEEAMGAALNTTPRAVDKTIPAIDITKANLVDVTAKVDLPSVQVKFPSADKVVLDTKRRTVMFMHGTTPLEAIAVDKPQLKEWYGIEGAKLLGEITQPVVAQVAPLAPPLSKMETPAAKQPWEMTREEFGYGAENDWPLVVSSKGKIYGVSAQQIRRAEQKATGKFETPFMKTPEAAQKWVDTTHRQIIKKAIAEGKLVPPEVLADYPDLSTTLKKGTATTISNQKTGISTSTPVSLRVGTDTGAGAVKWGKWIDAVGTRRTDGVGGGDIETIKTPITYRLGSGMSPVRAYAPTKAADKGISGPFVPETGKRLELKGDFHTYYITQKSEADAIAEGNPSYRPFSVLEASSGNLIGWGSKVKDAIGNAQETINNFREIYPNRVEQAVADHGEMANPASVPTALITSTSVPAAAPSIGNATPAHGLIDYSRIELNGTTSQTSPKVLASVGNAGKRSRVETEGFDNYIQNTTGTKDTSLSPFAKFKEGRDLQVRRYENEFDGLMKTPAGAEWMTLAIEADEVLREEYTRPFSINEAGERVYAEGEFAPAILNRYLKQYGPNFGKFLQHLQRAGISTEPTLGLSAEKEALKQKHIYDARMSLVNFQKNEPQLFTAYMAAADELGNANALLAEFYKGMISPETYANDKANPHYYVSLSAGRTDVFDRSGVAPLERTHGLTDLENVVPPLEGLKAVYVDAIRAQGINNAKKEAVRSNKNSEVATTELSDSIVHLKENGVDRAYDVHDTNVTQSVHNLTLKKPEVPTWEKHLVKDPTTALRLFATGLNPAFGLYNIMRDTIQSIGTVPFDPTGLVKGTIRAFKSPQLSQWFDSYRDPMMSKGARATEAIKKILEIVTFPNEIGEGLIRSITAETIIHRGGTYLDQLHGYYASTGFFALHGTFFNDFIPSCIPFTRATIAVVRAAYRNTFYGLPIGDKGGTFSGKQGAEKLAGRNLATIIFTIVSALAIKEAGKEKEYKLLRDRASYFYFPTQSGAWVKLPVPIGFVPIKGIVDSLFGYKSDPLGVAGQTLNVIPGLEAFMLPPALALFLQYKFNINFFTGAAITAAVGTPAANPLEAALMKTGMDEGQAAFLVRAFLADIPSQVQYVFDMVAQGSSTQAFPASKRFIVKDPTTSSNAAVDDFYALVDAAARSNNPTLKHYVNARAVNIGKLLHNAKLYPADAKVYMTTATDNIIATFATIAENPSDYGIKKFGPFSWRSSGNYEELAP